MVPPAVPRLVSGAGHDAMAMATITKVNLGDVHKPTLSPPLPSNTHKNKQALLNRPPYCSAWQDNVCNAMGKTEACLPAPIITATIGSMTDSLTFWTPVRCTSLRAYKSLMLGMKLSKGAGFCHHTLSSSFIGRQCAMAVGQHCMHLLSSLVGACLPDTEGASGSQGCILPGLKSTAPFRLASGCQMFADKADHDCC